MWQAAYRQGKRQVPDENLVFGSAVHAVIEKYVAGQAPDPVALWDETWVSMTSGSKAAETVWNMDPLECQLAGRRIFSSEDVLPVLDLVKPMYTDGKAVIERKMEWVMEKGIPPIIGYIDCICDDGVPLDFKTASRMWTPGRARAEMQPLFYLSALEDAGEHSHGFKFRHLVITKGQYPIARIFETQRYPEELETLRATVQQVWDKISSAEFDPNPASWLCSPACPVWADCPEAQAKYTMTDVMY